jgi:hypothetical protein
VGSLSQLYAQALALSVLLRERCRRLAAASGGRVDPQVGGGWGEGGAARGEGGAARGEGGAAGGEGGAPGDEAPGREIKDPRRAAEKALVRYGGDVSRLLDICRCACVRACVYVRAGACVLAFVRACMRGCMRARCVGGCMLMCRFAVVCVRAVVCAHAFSTGNRAQEQDPAGSLNSHTKLCTQA